MYIIAFASAKWFTGGKTRKCHLQKLRFFDDRLICKCKSNLSFTKMFMKVNYQCIFVRPEWFTGGKTRKCHLQKLRFFDDRLICKCKSNLFLTKSLMKASFQHVFVRPVIFALANLFAQIAQLVEQRTENPRVAGSIPALGTLQV